MVTAHQIKVRTAAKIFAVCIFVALLSPSLSHAVCTNPAGTKADIIYNGDENVLQYCDDTNWVKMAQSNYQANGVSFDRTNDYISKASDLSGLSDSKQVTVSFWFRKYDANIPSTYLMYTNAGNRFWFYMDTAEDFSFRGDDSSGTGLFWVKSPSLTDTDWHHILFSIDTSNQAHMAIDGTIVAHSDIIPMVDGLIDFTRTTHHISADNAGDPTEGYNGDMADFWIDFGTYLDLTDPQNIAKFITSDGKPVNLGSDGSRPTGSAPEIFFTGGYDAFATNRGTGGAFTGNGSFKSASTNPIQTNDFLDGLVSHWTLDEESGSTIEDNIGGNTATYLGNGSITSSNGVIGSASYHVDDDWEINAGSDASLDNIFASGGTITAWIKPTGKPYYDYGRIVDKAADNSAANGFSLLTTIESAPAMSLRFQRGFDTGYSGWTTPAGSLKMNQWNHIALVYQDGAPTAAPTMYINGVAQTLAQSSTGSGSASSDAAEDFIIGKAKSYRGFEGHIDEVRVYDRLLSAGEVEELAMTCSDPAGTSGEMIYNGDDHVAQYCNGSIWVAMGPFGDGGAGCTNPVGTAGDMIYNDDDTLLQYCEGDEWIAVGKNP